MTMLGPVASTQADEGHTQDHGCRPAVRALPGLGGPYAEALAFNRHKVFVGGAATPNEEQVLATYWRHGRLRVIPTGLEFDEAYDINDSGLIIGNGLDPTTGDLVGWAFTRGTVHRLRGIGSNVFARRVNEAGTIVGTVTTTDGVNRPALWHRWWSKPVLLRLLEGDNSGEAMGINDRGVVVGASVTVDFNSSHPVLWDTRGRVTQLATRPADGLAIGRAFAINNDRMVAGGLTDPLPTTPLDAVRWSPRRLVDIGTLPGADGGFGVAIADNGWIVGTNGLTAGGRRGFFWPGHGRMLAVPGLTSDWATADSSIHGIDAEGTASGTSIDDSGIDHATVWTCVQRLAFEPPRPATTRSSGAKLGQAKQLLDRADQSVQRHLVR